MVPVKPLLVGLGEVLWDVFPDGKRVGGAPANVVYHALHHGVEGCLISAVGKDSSGRELRESLQQKGVSVAAAEVPYPTGRVEVTLHHGTPSYHIVEGVAWDHIPLTEEAVQLVGRAQAVCFGSLAFRAEESCQTLFALLHNAPQEAWKVLDVNLRKPYYSAERLQQLLAVCNVLKVNDEEVLLLRQLLGWQGSPEEICRQLQETYRLRALILTQGAQGSTVWAGEEVSRLDTPAVQVADTVGAGDSFTGSFMAALLNGKSLRQAHRQAVQTAAFVCSQAGAWPEYPINLQA